MADTSQDIEQLLPQSQEDRAHTYTKMPEQDIYFLSKQYYTRQQYELYDLKLKLSPFARESALVDALQQALSALSVGIYQREAVEVIDRLGEAYTKQGNCMAAFCGCLKRSIF